MHRWLACTLAVVSMGCSFIDDFGRFETRTGGVDGGRRVDSGRPPPRPDAGPNPLQEGDACDPLDNTSCHDAALFCFAGRCNRVCNADSQCTSAPWTFCASVSITETETRQVCLGHECDPIDTATCAGGTACFAIGTEADGGPRLATACVPSSGRSVADDPCVDDFACAPGFICYPGFDTQAECHRWCDPGDITSCGGDEEGCLDLGAEGPNGGLGLCALPCDTANPCPPGQYCDGDVFCGTI